MLTDVFHMKHGCFYLVRVYKFLFTLSIFILNFLFPISNIPFPISQLHLTSHFIKMPLQKIYAFDNVRKMYSIVLFTVCVSVRYTMLYLSSSTSSSSSTAAVAL